MGDPAAPRRTPADGRFVAGTVLAGRYRIVSLLGRGGMGEVYKADDLTLDHPVALKFLPDSLGLSAAALSRFHAEARIARQVSHPNVCRVYDIGEVDGLRFLTMEFIDGEDLSSLLRRIGRLPGDKAVEIARQLCAGLAAAHDAGVVHRDLKPANVMIDGRGRARITDFGVAAIAREVRGADALAGTPAYMAPEQLKGREASVRSDVYSLGLVLYELFTGKRAVEAKNLSEALMHHSAGTPVTTPSSWIGDISPAVERAILRCLESDPAARPASAIQVAAALPGGDPLQAALAAGETPSPEMVAAAGSTDAWRPAVGLGLLAAIVVAFTAGTVLGGRRAVIGRVGDDLSADVLSHRARELFTAFGYDDAPADRASGFQYLRPYLLYDRLQRQAAGDRIERLAKDRPSVIQFWYRESPEPLVVALRPQSAGPGPPRLEAVGFDNPPVDIPNMRAAVLDLKGRLVEFRAVPAEFTATDAPDRMNWDAVFAAAGLDRGSFQEAPSIWTPPDAFDERRAWAGVVPEQPDLSLRLEAAAYRGRLVALRTLGPWDSIEPRMMTPVTGRIQLVPALTTVLVLAALVLAWANVRSGRGDKRGAQRLGVTLLCASLLDWVLSIDHVLGPGEFQLFRLGVGSALFLAASGYLVYLALEPHVRRRWPGVLIGWSRLLAGRFRDPLVGREVLMGIALSGVGFVTWLGLVWAQNFTTDADVGFPLTNLLSVRRTSGSLAILAGGAVFSSVLTCFLLLVLRAVLRSVLVAAAVVITLAAVNSLSGEWTRPALGALSALLSVIALMRFGLLAAWAFFATAAVGRFLQAGIGWYGAAGAPALIAILALAAYACYLAIGSPPLLPRRASNPGNALSA